MAGSSIYYWDACLFLAWLKDEATRQPGEMDGVRDVVDRVKRRDVQLVTSTITFTEVMSADLPAGVANLFRDLMKRRNVTPVSVDVPIANFASDLRAHYKARPTEYNGKTISTPDAIHLATAILYKVDEFHTFDNGKKGNSLGLLQLDGNVGGHKMRVCKPTAFQMGMDLRAKE